MIILCNYYGMCDEKGRCVGHPVKVTKEYGMMLRQLGEVKLIASSCIVHDSDLHMFAEVKELPYNISIVGNSIYKRIVDKIKIMRNIQIALKEKGNIFFYQVDFFFFLYMWVLYKKSDKRKIYCLIYQQSFADGKLEQVLQRIMTYGLNKVDGVIYTQCNRPISHSNIRWIPDYVFDYEKYGPYIKKNKELRAVALGTMNRYKQIEELVLFWKKVDMPLIIVGKFDDFDRYQRVVNMAASNVEIRNELIDYEEYNNLLSTSMFSILPYNMEQYRMRTSGVLLESIYMGAVAVAPKELLEQNNLPGLGYEDISEISSVNFGMAKQVTEKYEMLYTKYGHDAALDAMKYVFER